MDNCASVKSDLAKHLRDPCTLERLYTVFAVQLNKTLAGGAHRGENGSKSASTVATPPVMRLVTENLLVRLCTLVLSLTVSVPLELSTSKTKAATRTLTCGFRKMNQWLLHLNAFFGLSRSFESVLSSGRTERTCTCD